MQNQLEARPSRSPVLKKVGAGLILVIAAALAIKLVVGLIMGIFWVIVAAAVVVAVLWAIKTIVW
ncbi:MAG: hypothetical protein WBP81_22725 [Solirubrobacteraceae bacterium]|jgi:hypothetical protein